MNNLITNCTGNQNASLINNKCLVQLLLISCMLNILAVIMYQKYVLIEEHDEMDAILVSGRMNQYMFKYEATTDDPIKDGILLGLGLAKTGSTSLLEAFCEFRLLYSNCRNKKPEDKYWHGCVNKYFQPHVQNTSHLFRYDVNDILDVINSNTLDSCSIDGWIYYSFSRGSGIGRRKDNSVHPRRNHRRKLYFNDLKGYHAKTTNHFGSIYIPYILNNAIINHNMNLKFYVLIRNPLSRILSSYIFMVGYEKKYIPNRYGNINTFIQNDLNNTYLMNIINELDKTNTNIMNLNWEYIFAQWILYEANTRKICSDDKKYLQSIADIIANDRVNAERNISRYQPRRKLLSVSELRRKSSRWKEMKERKDRIIGIKSDLSNQNAITRAAHTKRKLDLIEMSTGSNLRKRKPNEHRERRKDKPGMPRFEFTCERDVFRATIGDSCYIVPLMFWINVFGKNQIINRLKILQTELLVDNIVNSVAKLICFWQPDYQECMPDGNGDIGLIETLRNQKEEKASRFNNKKKRSRRRDVRDRIAGRFGNNLNFGITERSVRKATTFRYQDNENYPEFIVDNAILEQFNNFFKPCNRRLNELLTKNMPELMLEPFDVNVWDFEDT